MGVFQVFWIVQMVPKSFIASELVLQLRKKELSHILNPSPIKTQKDNLLKTII